jgi:protein tyrosine/serine phosphatase
MIRKVYLVIIVLTLFRTSTVAQNAQLYPELSNFYQVDAGLYRGAQPGRGGMYRLSKLGIKTVINLRNNDARARAEEREVHAAGLRYFNVPVRPFATPTDEQVNSILEIIDTPGNQPVFIHCKRGADRTGTIIALYRIAHDGWTSEQAKEEAKRYGMHWVQAEMKQYITDFYRRHKHAEVDGYWRTHVAGRPVFAIRRGLQESPPLVREGLCRLRSLLP